MCDAPDQSEEDADVEEEEWRQSRWCSARLSAGWADESAWGPCRPRVRYSGNSSVTHCSNSSIWTFVQRWSGGGGIGRPAAVTRCAIARAFERTMS